MFTKFHKRLVNVTRKCRPNMHEPDEQEVRAIVVGTHLDNAFGDNPTRADELTVGITNTHGGMEWFNLASLIALARIADPSKLDSNP